MRISNRGDGMRERNGGRAENASDQASTEDSYMVSAERVDGGGTLFGNGVNSLLRPPSDSSNRECPPSLSDPFSPPPWRRLWSRPRSKRRVRIVMTSPPNSPPSTRRGCGFATTTTTRPMRGLNWVALRDSLRPLVERGESRDDTRAAISALLSRLGESHFGVLPGEAMDAGAATGIGSRRRRRPRVRFVDSTLVVTRVEAGAPAVALGIRPGWIIDEIDTLRRA